MMIYDSSFLSGNILSDVSRRYIVSETCVYDTNLYFCNLLTFNLLPRIKRAVPKKIKNKNN